MFGEMGVSAARCSFGSGINIVYATDRERGCGTHEIACCRWLSLDDTMVYAGTAVGTAQRIRNAGQLTATLLRRTETDAQRGIYHAALTGFHHHDCTEIGR